MVKLVVGRSRLPYLQVMDNDSLTFMLQNAETEEFDELFRRVERHLRQIASAQLRRERAAHTLQATALVDDAFIQLVGRTTDWEDRRHYFRAAAKVMRHILVDHERQRRAEKRGGGAKQSRTDPNEISSHENPLDLLALDEALQKLSQRNARQAEVIQLLHFGGYTTDEIGRLLNVSPTTVKTDHKLARVWLFREMSGGG